MILFILLCVVWLIVVCRHKKNKIVKKETLGNESNLTNVEFNKMTSLSSALSSMNSDDAVIGSLNNTPLGIDDPKSTKDCINCGFAMPKSFKFCSECGHLQTDKNIKDEEVQQRNHADSELMYINSNAQTIGVYVEENQSDSSQSEEYMTEMVTIVGKIDNEGEVLTR